MTVDEIATFDYPNGKIELLSTSIWEGDPEGIRVLHASGLTEFDFILVVPEPFIAAMRGDGSILMFLGATRKLGEELLRRRDQSS